MKKLYKIVLFLFAVQFGSAQVNTIFNTKTSDFTISNKDIYKIINCTEIQTTTSQIGAPQLPVTTRTFALPQGSVVTNLSVANGSKIEIGVIFTYIQLNHLAR